MGVFLLAVAVIAVAGSIITIALAVSMGASETTGVARSLELIEKTINRQEVGKADLPVMAGIGFRHFLAEQEVGRGQHAREAETEAGVEILQRAGGGFVEPAIAEVVPDRPKPGCRDQCRVGIWRGLPGFPSCGRGAARPCRRAKSCSGRGMPGAGPLTGGRRAIE